MTSPAPSPLPVDPRLDALAARLDALERRSQRQRRWLTSALAALAVLGSTTLFAQVTWAPPGFNVFNADSPALASQVNANFQWLVQNPGAAFLTTGTCPSGYTALEGGQYLRLGAPSLTPVARTLVTPAHRHEDFGGLVLSTTGAHTHTYGDLYWHDFGNVPEYGTPDGDGNGERPEAPRTTGSAGLHTHTASGRIGPAAGAVGDSNIAITGELQHITLRLCVRT